MRKYVVKQRYNNENHVKLLMLWKSVTKSLYMYSRTKYFERSNIGL